VTQSTRYAADQPEEDLPLSRAHRDELLIESAINPAVVAARGYVTVGRPKANLLDAYGRDTRKQLLQMGFPSWSVREDYYFPGLLIPQYTARGVRYPGQWKPSRAVPNRDGKLLRYANAKGPARLDVHPFWSADRGGMLLPAINDHRIPLWLTEGTKKADALTSRGVCTVALAGVFSWRNVHAALGDWEDIRLKDREIIICFDADAVTKPLVAQAMARLGKWLQYKGAAKVWYLVVPPAAPGGACKGVDDFFAAGGTIGDLEKAMESKPPQVTDTEDRWTDARMAETVAYEVLDGRYAWAKGMDWLAWNGKRWQESHEVTVLETVRQWALGEHAAAAARMRDGRDAAAAEVDGWRTMLSSNRMRTVVTQARGIVEKPAAAFDADPDLLNTPDGVVNMLTGDLLPHDPDLLCTKITSGCYRPGFRHPDWDRALEVLPTEAMRWLQVVVGQAITGHPMPDGVVPILKGGGENGKSLLTTDGLVPALGGYAGPASAKLFEKGQHSTEQVNLRGMRLVIAEELTEGRSIDITALKRVVDVTMITARETHKNNITFPASHTLFATTNYTPIIAETDDGTWRRLVLVVFPYRYVKPGLPIKDPERERRGDPTLKGRIRANRDRQHDAAVTWAVEGALAWYANADAIAAAVANGKEAPSSILLPPLDVAADTLAWRVEADRILGYWHACLVVDPTAVILSNELCEHFNEWLRGSGHTPWAKETFHPRFRDHTETRAHRIRRSEKKRTRSIAANIVRRPGVIGAIPSALPTQAEVITGLRWRTDEDDA
jgi:P4 family phage/plasmid primase-like protien